MSYNGWANWDTWNVALWLGNEEGVYRRALVEARRVKGPVTVERAEAIVRYLMPHGTPDMARRQGSAVYAAVDWSEIARDLTELKGEED